MERSKNDFWDYLEHAEWKNHKYIRIENGRYIYPEDLVNKSKQGTNISSNGSRTYKRPIKNEAGDTSKGLLKQDTVRTLINKDFDDILEADVDDATKYEAYRTKQIQTLQQRVDYVEKQLKAGKDPIEYPISMYDDEMQTVSAERAKIWLYNEEDGDLEIIKEWKQDLKDFKAGKGMTDYTGKKVKKLPKGEHF